MNRHRPARLLVLLLAASAGVHAGTVIEYRHEGDCPTDFDRMTISGLRARIDMHVDGTPMSTIADDGEQLMTQVLHELGTYMTMESDDDAIDFQSDVMRSSHIHAGNEAAKVTGMDSATLTARLRAQQVASCPEMANLGFGDPDYADAAARCAETMAGTVPSGDRRQAVVAAMAGGRASHAANPAAPQDAAATPWRTTRTERGEEATIDGRHCRVERTVRGDTVLREDCLSPIADLDLEPAALRRLNRIATVGATVGRGLAELHPEAADEAGPPSVPLRRRCYRDGRPAGTATLSFRSGVDVPQATFEVPAGYRPMQIGAPDGSDAP